MANEVFIWHYFTLYFLSIRIKQLNKSGSLSHTYECQLLALMRIKLAGTAEEDNNTPLVFYAVLLFVQAFSRVWFFDHFNWRM